MLQLLRDFHAMLSLPANRRPGFVLESVSQDNSGTWGFEDSDGKHVEIFEIIRDQDDNDICVRWISSDYSSSHFGDYPNFYTRLVQLEISDDCLNPA